MANKVLEAVSSSLGSADARKEQRTFLGAYGLKTMRLAAALL
jgi:hypothetical protein